MLYYGDETGFYVPGKNGFGDPYNRAPYPWADQGGTPNQSVLDWYALLGSLRHSLPALRNGSLVTLSTKRNIYAFARVLPPDKPVVVALNKGTIAETATISLRGLYPSGATLQDQLTGTRFSAGSVTVPPRGGVVLVGTS